MASNTQAIVIDNGSETIKAGFAGHNAPRYIIPAVVGRLKYPNLIPNSKLNKVYAGDEALLKRGILTLKYPIDRGSIVSNIDDIEQLWYHVFYNELCVAPDERPVMLTECSWSSTNRDMMTQIMFETFNTPKLYTATPSVLALYHSGRTNGYVLDCGYGTTWTTPIWEGYPVLGSEHSTDLAGFKLDEHIVTKLSHRNVTVDMRTARDIKEKLCYVALDYEQERQIAASSSQLERQYTLPDGQVITLNEERFSWIEPLFQPVILGTETNSLHHDVYYSIMKSDVDIRRDLVNNIVLTGGTTMFPGLAERLQRELTQLAPATMPVRVIAPPDRNHSVWIGGSILASLPEFQDQWITMAEYAEVGPKVSRKCL